MTSKRICIITGSRAEWGLLRPVAERLRREPGFAVTIAATGMHLSPEFGATVQTVRDSWPDPVQEVETLLSSDSGRGVAKSVGLGVIGFADALQRMAPDLVLLLGDRFEIFAAAQACLFLGIPVAHLCGGDVTEGAYDDAMRHAISKMAHLHFPTNQDAANRLARMGESPQRIFLAGSPGIDALLALETLSREELAQELDFALPETTLLVTCHPETLADSPSAAMFAELLQALDALGPEVGIVITHPNADNQGRELQRMAKEFAAARSNVIDRVSLGQKRYLSLMRHCSAVVGNSSSGLYEAPSFKKPTVNIGDRQKGRLRASSVIDCPPQAKAIVASIRRALDLDCSKVQNPYGDGNASERIAQALKSVQDWPGLLRKAFYEKSDS